MFLSIRGRFWDKWLRCCHFAVALLLPATLTWAQEPLLPDVVLTTAEQAWLEKHPTIRLAVDIDWAPFEFVDEQKQYRGMAAEYVRLVEERLGITLQVDTERPWAEMVEAVKARDLDVFSLVVQTPQRDKFVNFTKPYISFPMVIFTRDDQDFIDGLDALHKHEVGVVESYATHDLLARNHPNLKLSLAKNVHAGLEAVSTGKTFAFVGNLAVATQVIRETGLTNLKISGQTPYRFELSMAVRKDWPELVPILQKALDSITPEQRDAIYNRWVRVKYEAEVDWRWFIISFGAGGILVTVFFFWNRKLQAEVNQRKRAEKDLNRESLRLQEIIWGTNVGTWEWNVQTGETTFNERWAEIIGYSLDELESTTIDTWTKYAHPDDLKRSSELLDKNFSRELERYECEIRMRHRNGQWVWVVDRGKVVEWSDDDKPLRMAGTHTDITERKKVGTLKDEFISTVSHELRTPLTSIKGALGLVSGGAMGGLSSDAMEMVELAQKNTERLILLVNDILDVEKLESGVVDFQLEPVVLNDLIQDCIDANAAYAEEFGVEFIFLQGDDTAIVKADPNRLDQALTNLLSNAAKFSPEGSKVEVSTGQNGQGTCVKVKDYGPGIPESFRENIFGRFQQMDGSDSREKGGTGLGLNITRMIIEKHGGTIGYDTKMGQGTTFYFTLPNVE
ncbi:MAG: transporter substrate-binding domain-containing protein [Magnetovibrio sp.]|nr:transporter substrate-binding domain-containing protein [Magnetovibrio sp.]